MNTDCTNHWDENLKVSDKLVSLVRFMSAPINCINVKNPQNTNVYKLARKNKRR